jgi:hypothetical protein
MFHLWVIFMDYSFFQTLVCAEILSKFSQGVVLTSPSLLLCSRLDAFLGFFEWSWCLGLPPSPSGLWCGADAWVLFFFLVGLAP